MLLAASRIIAITGLGLGAFGILARLGEIMRRPFKNDLSRPRGNIRRGILYAFTLGMAPWEKESTQLHWAAYFRGILFHLGIFAAFGALILSPWLFAGSGPTPASMPVWLQAIYWILVGLTGAGGLAGLLGVIMRWADENERFLSVPDDYFAVVLTSLFVAAAFVALLLPAWLPAFYIVTGLTGIYIPISKIRHCVYFFYAKFFFGAGFGRRGVIGQAKSEYAE